MRMRTIVTLSVILALGGGNGWAMAHKVPRHHHRAHLVRYQEQPVSPAPYSGGRLVLHPAENIACNTRDRATRALPCDQPVWVYGSPCEIDLGLGRSRSCD
jgi:hypothetical protein